MRNPAGNFDFSDGGTPINSERVPKSKIFPVRNFQMIKNPSHDLHERDGVPEGVGVFFQKGT